MIPKNISRTHILQAIEEIETKGVPKCRESGKFLLLHMGKRYPPKYVVSLASKLAGGTELDSSEFGGGQETNLFLKRLGFEVVEVASVKRRKPSTPTGAGKRKNSSHSERCRKCKGVIESMLQKIYGDVEVSHTVEASTRLEDYANTSFYSELRKIYHALQRHRHHRDFVRSRRLRPCDFFVPNPGFVVEFDESQHFNTCRKVSLANYPTNLKLRFKKEKWIGLCERLDRHDRSPPYRDEQRAWYDTLRDFLPTIKGFKPTIRLYSRDSQWCSLNPHVAADVERFRLILEGKVTGRDSSQLT